MTPMTRTTVVMRLCHKEDTSRGVEDLGGCQKWCHLEGGIWGPKLQSKGRSF